MGGELVPSQFRYTTTNNRDFVIGDPTDPIIHDSKYLVFQGTTKSGYGFNPHIKAVWNDPEERWEILFSEDGENNVNFAYQNRTNLFTGNGDTSITNTFDTPVLFSGTNSHFKVKTSLVPAGKTIDFDELVVRSELDGFASSLNLSNYTLLTTTNTLTAAKVACYVSTQLATTNKLTWQLVGSAGSTVNGMHESGSTDITGFKAAEAGFFTVIVSSYLTAATSVTVLPQITLHKLSATGTDTTLVGAHPGLDALIWAGTLVAGDMLYVAMDSGIAATHKILIERGIVYGTSSTLTTLPWSGVISATPLSFNMSTYQPTGSFTLTGNGGTGPYTYSLNNSLTTVASASVTSGGQVSFPVPDTGLSNAIIAVHVTDSSTIPVAGSVSVLVNAVTATATAPVISSVEPANQNVVAGNTATFSISTPSGTWPFTYQWYKNSTLLPLATAITYSSSTTLSNNGDTYYVTVSGPGGSTTSRTATLTVTATAIAPQITTQPVDRTVTVGQTATFSVVATGSPTPTYQWRKAGVDIVGATSSSYTTPATVIGDNNSSYTVGITNASGTVTSNSAILSVNAATAVAPTITSGYPSNQSVTETDAVTFSIPTPSGTGPFTYQWYKNSALIPSATGISYSFTSALTDNGNTYYVIVTGSGGTATSRTATLTVNAAYQSPTATITAPTVNQVFADSTTSITIDVHVVSNSGMPIQSVTGKVWNAATNVITDIPTLSLFSGTVFHGVWRGTTTVSSGTMYGVNADIVSNGWNSMSSYIPFSVSAVTSTSSISGNSGGISGTTISWYDGTAKTTASTSGGGYSITVSYGWTGNIAPTKTGYIFSPLTKNYNGVTTNIINQDYTATTEQATTYTIIGNAGAPYASISYVKDGNTHVPTASSNGDYSITVPSGWSGVITPSLTDYTFSPATRSFTGVAQNYTSQNYTAIPQYIHITGTTTAGTTLTLSGASSGTGSSVTADLTTGAYSITVPSTWSGTVVPSLSGYTFSPTSKSYNFTNAEAGLTGQNYTATSTAVYLISGNVRYVDGWSVTDVAIYYPGGYVGVDNNGAYAFSVPAGSSGTFGPEDVNFEPYSRTYTNISANKPAQFFRFPFDHLDPLHPYVPYV